MSKRGWGAGLCLLFFSVYGARAQAGQVEADSLRSYELGEIVIGGEDVEAVQATTMQRVSLASLVREDAAAVSEVARLIPSATVQTNSRGETLVYIRNAGERQVALFFDGALLNIPWDNRVDLSLVPTGMMGGMTVAKGVPSVHYGTNVLGGAVNVTSRSLGRTGTFTEATAMLGTVGQRQGVLTHLRRNGPFSFAGSIGYSTRDAMALPGEVDLPYSQRSRDTRTNTDRELFNLFGRASYRLMSGGEVGVSLLHVDGEKGVAPESHLDPTVDRVRFWRYPLWRNTMLILNGTRPLGHGGYLRGSVWGSRFVQRIDQFSDDAYRSLTDRQDDEDVTVGGRFQWLRPLGPGSLTLSLNLLTSRHRQVDTGFDGEASPEPRQTYQQHVYSLGAEYDVAVSRPLSLIVGGSLDGIATPRTGDKPARDPTVDAGMMAGMVYQLGEGLAWKISAGRKVRFPTMRELFGDALNRFLVNPDLKPESSLLTETGLVLQREVVAGEVLAFLNRTFDTIDQRTVTVEERRLRQRINLEGSRVYGVEVVGKVQPVAPWSLEGHMTWMQTRGFNDAGPDRVLVEKPEWLGTLTFVYNAARGLSLMGQAVYTGRAYGLDPDNELVGLPTSVVLNTRAAFRFFFPGKRVFGELFLRVDNLADTLTMPQLGLPGPGREFRGGMSVSL